MGGEKAEREVYRRKGEVKEKEREEQCSKLGIFLVIHNR